MRPADGRPDRRRPGPVPGTLVLGVGLFLAFTANGRPISAGDTLPATLLPVALLRGDRPVLDRFGPTLRTPEGAVPSFAAEARGHIVPRYPLGPALLAVPFYAPQLALLDLGCPGWERDLVRALQACDRMGKNAAAALAALGASVLVLLLRRFGFDRVAVPAALIVALDSDGWSVASQGL